MNSKRILTAALALGVLVAAAAIVYLSAKNRLNLQSQQTQNEKQEEVQMDQTSTPEGLTTNITPNSYLTSPIKISGTVPSGWMFEGSFPINITDSNGELVAQGQGKETIPGSWQNKNPIEFSAEIEYTLSPTLDSGYIVLKKDNPSSLEANDQTFQIPVKFGTPGS